jgi:predicted DNA-binding transcriptional regulator AlpA
MSKKPLEKIFVLYSQLQDVLGFKYDRVHLNRLIAAGRFPAPRRLSENRIAWLYSELIDWANKREPVRKAGRGVR